MLGGGCGGLFGIIWFIIVRSLPTTSPRLSVWVGRLKMSSQSKISDDSRHVLYKYITKYGYDSKNYYSNCYILRLQENNLNKGSRTQLT